MDKWIMAGVSVMFFMLNVSFFVFVLDPLVFYSIKKKWMVMNKLLFAGAASGFFLIGIRFFIETWGKFCFS